jgi:hypothetical protein
MNASRNNLLILLGLVASIPTAWAVDKEADKGKFTPPAIESLTNQTNEAVTIGAAAYNRENDSKAAFGKVNPYEHGVLPVLLVIRNNSKQTVRLSEMTVEYVDASRERIDPTPAAEVKYSNKGPRRPNMNPGPIPGVRLGGRKNPLESEMIEIRGFSAKMLPPGESAHGFVYFRTGHRKGAKLYIANMKDASSGKELFYFELPLD